MVNYEKVRELARAFRGNLNGWPEEIIRRVHREVLKEDEFNPDPDILDCIHREIIPILQNAEDEEDAAMKILEIEGSPYWRHLSCWLSDYRHGVFAEEAFRAFRSQPNADLFKIVRAGHHSFKRQIGECLLRMLIERANDER